MPVEDKKEKIKPTPKKIVGYAVTAILVVIFCLVVVAFATVFVQIGQHKTPSLFGYRFYFVLTDSMTPGIQPGEVILSKEVTEKTLSKLKVGDVVTYVAETGEMKGNHVTHRIVESVHYDEQIGDYVVLTKGDKLGAMIDYPVRTSRIEAVMVKKSAFMGWLLGIFDKGAGFALVIALPLVIMLVCLIVKLVLTIKMPAAEKEKADEKTKEEEKNKRIEELKKQALEEFLAQNKPAEAQEEAEENAENIEKSE